MLRQLEQKILQTRKATGIEMILLPGDKFYINAVTVSLKKNKVIKEQSYIGIESLDELAEKTDMRAPLSIVLNGKGVLTKRRSSSEPGHSVQSIIHGSNPNDFYFENFTNSHISVGSVVRKETFDKLIGQLKNKGLKPISVSLGFNSLPGILPFLKPGKDSELNTGSFVVTVNDQNEISDFRIKEEVNIDRYQPGELAIADHYIKPLNLLSFSAAVKALTDDLRSAPAITSSLISSGRAEFRYAKLFKAAGLGLLTFFFIVLLLNFFVYNNLLQKNQSLQSSQFQNLEQQKKNTKLKAEVTKKETFLQRSGWNNAGRTSYYADRIGSMTPGSLVLTSLNIFPYKTITGTEDGDNTFKRGIVQINGVCRDPAELNQFIGNLKFIPAFREVILKSYQYRKEKENGIFLIETAIKE